MSRIKLMVDRQYAPCCFLIVRQNDKGEWDTRDEANTVLIQTDWSYPGLAGTFGAGLKVLVPGDCEHSGTDGTIDCPECGATALDFITRASVWLHDNQGVEADDPGYFD